MTTPDQPGKDTGQGPAPTEWLPPHEWSPIPGAATPQADQSAGHSATSSPATGMATAQTQGSRESVLTATPRRRAWLIFANMVALLGIYLSIITYYLTSHMTDRYEQVPPGRTVTAQKTDYTLLELREITAPPSSSGGETDKPEKNTAYAMAKLRVVTHNPEVYSFLCGADLVGPGHRNWGHVYMSTLPPSKDEDDCENLKLNVPVEVNLAFAYPKRFEGQIVGVGVDPNNGTPDQVLTPPS